MSWTSSLELSADGPQAAGLVIQPTQIAAQIIAEDVFILSAALTAIAVKHAWFTLRFGPPVRIKTSEC